MSSPESDQHPPTIVELLVSFRGIAAPTSKAWGTESCALELACVVDGKVQPSNTILFAYPFGGVWKATLVEPEAGLFRLSVISDQYNCSKDFEIDEPDLESGVISLEFSNKCCRRRLIPPILKRMWRDWLAWRETRKDDPRNDAKVLASIKRRFRRGPIGVWVESHDRLTVYGASYEFRTDHSGTIEMWGYEDFEEETDGTPPQEFLWRSVDDLSIEVTHNAENEEWQLLNLDFEVARSPYGRRQILMVSDTVDGETDGVNGFWLSHCPVSFVT